ncbi:alpha/beta hydrolase [Kitasatospora sp. NPDC093558]|uniref:alpha/beta hydrolase n=1 Tax=Kitasatospora sp. NPDC093558 TaxID=3155201 RepID=UPI0034233FF7
MDIATLYNANLNNIITAKTAIDTLFSAFGKHVESWQHDVADKLSASHWTGSTSATAQGRIKDFGGELQAAHQELSFVSKALANAAEQFALAQAHLVNALGDAKNAKLNVAPDGRITWNNEPTSPDFAGASAEQTAIAISNRITAALNEAAHADQEISARLNHLATNASNGTGLDAATVAKDQAAETAREQIPAAGTDPGSVKQWWTSLTDTERQNFITTHPDQIGNLDGVPAIARDEANRLNLTHLVDQYEHKPNLSDDDKRKLDGFRAIQMKLDQAKSKIPPAFLIGVSDEGQGRGILSWGNPDTAQNVSAYVPGLGTTLSAVGGKDADRARNVWQATHNADPSASVASIVWLGYDPPLGSRTPEVMGTPRAEKGAAAYDKFLNGLRATHDGPPAHLVALGHSYGSLTVGLAAQLPGGTGANDVILVGSPGTEAQKASQLHGDPHHVWVGDAENDPVSHLPSPPRVQYDLGAANIGTSTVGVLGTIAGGALGDVASRHFAPDQVWFGRDPANHEFGANRFKVADGLENSFDSHSNYMEDPTGDYTADPSKRENLESINNIGQIAAGKYDNVTRQSQR